MGNECNVIRLYTAQADVVVQALRRDGVCFSREAYVRRKYQESAPIFVTAYAWFVSQLPRYVPKPAGAEYPYWAFQELYSVDATGACVQTLDVPKNEAVFFDVMDWTKIMRLSYIGETPEEELCFQEELRSRGLSGNDVLLTGFYPEYRQKILTSWSRLFRHHQRILAGDTTGAHSVQAGLWQLRREWLVEE